MTPTSATGERAVAYTTMRRRMMRVGLVVKLGIAVRSESNEAPARFWMGIGYMSFGGRLVSVEGVDGVLVGQECT